MNKYILYRVGLASDEEENQAADQEAELVAVEYGGDLDDVLEDLLRDVRDDLAGMDENAGQPPFDFLGVVLPPYAEKNILWDYTVEVEEQ